MARRFVDIFLVTQALVCPLPFYIDCPRPALGARLFARFYEWCRFIDIPLFAWR
jgi:hypothetical protein